jgi:hypothetical protein
MQPSGLHRRQPAPTFVNHTPKTFEITAPGSPSQSPEMFGPAGMAVGAGPFYTNAIMGQAPSATTAAFDERDSVRKASGTIIREDFSIRIEEEYPRRQQQQLDSGIELSSPDSWSLNFAYTDQAPYCSSDSRDGDTKMMTQQSLPRLPRENKSYDLAYFLRTTGPTAPHRRPSKVGHPRRSVAAPKKALRFLKLGQRRPSSSIVTAHDKSVICDGSYWSSIVADRTLQAEWRPP